MSKPDTHTGGLFDHHFGPIQPQLLRLPGETNRESAAPSVADVCIYRFACDFRTRMMSLDNPARVPKEVGDLALCCLLLAAQYPISAAPPIVQALYSARDCLETLPTYADLEMLPFSLCLEFVGQPIYATSNLLPMLAAAGSGVRLFVFELAWLARNRITAKSAVPLLQNVEDTLGHWLESMALARHLFANPTSFWEAADSFVPTRVPDQYRDRIARVRENQGLIEYPVHFLSLETDCRRRIDSTAYRLDSLPPDFLSLSAAEPR